MFVFLGDDGVEGVDGTNGPDALPGTSGDDPLPATAPGDGTDGGNGEEGEGLIGHLLDQSDVLSDELEVQVSAGWGGNGGNGGIGGDAGAEDFNGGDGGWSGNGGAGGVANVGIDDITADTVTVLVEAGSGGHGGGWNSFDLFGNAGSTGADDAWGGHGGGGGHGGVGGSTSVTLSDSAVGFIYMQIVGGDGGVGGSGGDGGDGGGAGTGGGGDGGGGGNGGNGGNAALQVSGNQFATSDGRAFTVGGGSGGDGGFSGFGGVGAVGDGSYGVNGHGGNGGDATISLTGNAFEVTSPCGCEDAIVVVASAGQGGFGYASDGTSLLDGVSGSGGDASVTFTDNIITGTTGDDVISLAIYLNAGQGGVFYADPTDTTAGTKGTDGTTSLVFSDNTIDGGDGDDDAFQLDLESFVLDDADTGVGLAQLAGVAIDLTAGTFLIGSQSNTITGVEHIDLIVKDGYFDSNNDFYDNAAGAYLRGNGLGNDLGAAGGDDTLIGEAGDDTLNGYGGDDTVDGGLGDDWLYVDSVNDVVIERVGEGKDTVVSTITYSLVGTNIENLYLDGFDDIDGTGNDGKNLLTGSAGANYLDGGLGADSLYGGDGDDTYLVDNIGDKVYEDAGMGRDVVISTVNFNLTGRVVEVLYLIGSDNLNGTGNTLANTIYGNDGNNIINGGENFDKMYGGLGDDTYFVDNIDDKVYEFLNEGTDVVYSSVGFDLTGRHIEVVNLTGSKNVSVIGNSLANEIHGNDGNNRLDGGAGNDSLFGGLGDDTFVVNTTGDIVTEADGEGADTVEATRSYTLGDFVENLFLMGASDINGTGNGLNNALVGNEGHNILTGGLGDDSYYVQAGNDVVVEASGEGNDMVYSTVSFSLWGTHVEGLQLTGTADIDATGNNQVNSLFGNDGDNVINGGGAGDLLWGGIGADTFDFDAGCRADSIYDFDSTEGDAIDVSAFTGGVAYSNGVTVTQQGLHALINLGNGNLVWVRDTDATDAGFLGAIVW